MQDYNSKNIVSIIVVNHECYIHVYNISHLIQGTRYNFIASLIAEFACGILHGNVNYHFAKYLKFTLKQRWRFGHNFTAVILFFVFY